MRCCITLTWCTFSDEALSSLDQVISVPSDAQPAKTADNKNNSGLLKQLISDKRLITTCDRLNSCAANNAIIYPSNQRSVNAPSNANGN
jgi:hypothetical protein